MSYEKRFRAVPPRLFTTNGGTDGKITIASTKGLKVKQIVHIAATSLPTLELEVKRVEGKLTLYVGPVTGSIDNTVDISAYTTALSANIYAEKQNRTKVPGGEVERHTYEEEPTVARRVMLVDRVGEDIDSITDTAGINRLAVDANVSFTGAEVNLDLPDLVKITNILVVTANLEMTHLLEPKTDHFIIKIRDGEASMRLAFGAGETATKYTKINRGAVFNCSSMDLVAPFTIYFSAEKSAVTVEIINWYFS